jgi:hypothetical protein
MPIEESGDAKDDLALATAVREGELIRTNPFSEIPRADIRRGCRKTLKLFKSGERSTRHWTETAIVQGVKTV